MISESIKMYDSTKCPDFAQLFQDKNYRIDSIVSKLIGSSICSKFGISKKKVNTSMQQMPIFWLGS